MKLARHHVVTSIVAIVALVCGSSLLSACSADHHKTTHHQGLPQSLSVHTRVSTSLETRDLLHLRVAGRQYTQHHSRPVTVLTRRDTAGVVAAYDAEGHQRGLALVVDIDGVPHLPVHISYRSTALAQLALTPPFLTDNPFAVLAIRHAATMSPHLSTLTRLLKAHAARDPDYLQHPTDSELNEAAAMGADVNVTLKKETQSLHVRAGAAATNASYPLATSGCGHVLHQFAPANTGVCYAREPSNDRGVRLKATNTSPTWDMLFSSARTAAPLALIPPHTIKIPTVSDLLGVIWKVIGNAAKTAACEAWNGVKHIFGFGTRDKDCDAGDILTPITHFLGNFSSDGTAKLTILPELSTKTSFGVAGGKDSGDGTVVPFSGAPGRSVEAWHNMAFTLTVWTQFISPLIAVATDSPDETDTPPKSPSRKEKIRAAVTQAAATVDQNVTGLSDDMSSASATQIMKDLFALGWTILTTPAVISAILKIWNVQDYLTKKLKKVLEKYGPNLIPGIGWAKTIVEAGDRIANIATVGFGLYALAAKVPRYDSYISYKPLHQSHSTHPTSQLHSTRRSTRSRQPTPHGNDHTGHESRFRHEKWQAPFFTLTIHTDGRVRIQRMTGLQCKRGTNCQQATNSKPIPGAVATGHLTSESSPLPNCSMHASGTITKTSKSSSVPTGPLTITPGPHGGGGITVTVASKVLPAGEPFGPIVGPPCS